LAFWDEVWKGGSIEIWCSGDGCHGASYERAGWF